MKKRTRRPRRGSAALTIFIVVLVLAALVALANWVVMPLVVGRGREAVVPDVVGMDRFAAESTLVAVGLRLGEVAATTSPSVKVDRVISQSPPAGQVVKLGRAVRLDVSKGAGRIKVPHTAGLSRERAAALLSSSGLFVAAVESTRAPTLPPGQVVGTRPPAGASVNEGDSVIVEVASRQGTFPMPQLVGMNATNAARIAAAQGLVIGEQKQAPSDEPAGNVLLQYPEEGMLVREGDTIALIVAVKRGH
jgi:serine/threonine-protein kinase